MKDTSTSRLKVAVTQDEENPVPVSVLATAITDISSSFKRLTARGGLTREAVVILIASQSQLPKTTVRIVLNNLESLQAWACQK